MTARRDGGGPFSRIAVAVAGFGLLVVLAAYAPDWRNDERGGASALSRSAVGFAGIVALLRGLDVPVTVARTAAPPT